MIEELDLSKIKIPFFRDYLKTLIKKGKEIRAVNSGLTKEMEKIQQENNKHTLSKEKYIEELSAQKSQINLLKAQIEIQKKYLSTLVQADESNQNKGENESLKNSFVQLQVKNSESNSLIGSVYSACPLKKLIELPNDQIESLSQRFAI